jgi:hypothetical protein
MESANVFPDSKFIRVPPLVFLTLALTPTLKEMRRVNVSARLISDNTRLENSAKRLLVMSKTPSETTKVSADVFLDTQDMRHLTTFVSRAIAMIPMLRETRRVSVFAREDSRFTKLWENNVLKLLVPSSLPPETVRVLAIVTRITSCIPTARTANLLSALMLMLLAMQMEIVFAIKASRFMTVLTRTASRLNAKIPTPREIISEFAFARLDSRFIPETHVSTLPALARTR